MPKSHGVDVSWGVASDSFDEAITAQGLTSPRKLWAYTKSGADDWKKSIVWAEVNKHRLALTALMDATGGHNAHQKSLHAQLLKWLQGRGLAWVSADVEKSVYSLRTMVAHLRVFVRQFHAGKKKLPKGYDMLQPLCAKLLLPHETLPESSAYDNGDDHDADDGGDDVVMIVAPASSSHVAPSRPLVHVSSNESVNMAEIDRFLFLRAEQPQPVDTSSDVRDTEMDQLVAAAVATDPPSAAQIRESIKKRQFNNSIPSFQFLYFQLAILKFTDLNSKFPFPKFNFSQTKQTNE